MEPLQQIGRYQVIGELGRGAMGVVYRAHDPKIGRTVAIKTIALNSLATDEERMRLRDRLRREAQSAGVLSHPNIVTIYDVLDEGDKAYIFMEYVDGPTLESLIATGRVPNPGPLLDLLEQVAEGLDYAHSRGIVHRDIKPGNVMVHHHLTAKITDFGVARISSQPTGSTLSGTILGTPNYMSPEQIQGEQVDGRADQFSLAVMAYELLTGERPFQGEALPTLIYKIVHAEPPSPHILNGTLPAEVGPVFERALNKDARQRFGSCREFVASLDQALKASPSWVPLSRGAGGDLPTVIGTPTGGGGGKVVELPEPPRPRRNRDLSEGVRKNSRWLLWLGVPLALALAMAIGVYVWYSLTGYRPPVEPIVKENAPPPAPPPSVVVEQTPKPEPPAQEPAKEEEKKKEEPAEPARPVTQAQKPGPEIPSSQWHTLSLESEPAGASAVLENGRGCTTPCEIQVTAGRHTVVMTREGFAPVTRIIDVPLTKLVAVNLAQRTGRVLVSSQPPGATIRVNGQDWPVRTPTGLTLPVGRYKLEFLKEGLRNQIHEIEVREGAVATLEVNWSSGNP